MSSSDYLSINEVIVISLLIVVIVVAIIVVFFVVVIVAITSWREFFPLIFVPYVNTEVRQNSEKN